MTARSFLAYTLLHKQIVLPLRTASIHPLIASCFWIALLLLLHEGWTLNPTITLHMPLVLHHAPHVVAVCVIHSIWLLVHRVVVRVHHLLQIALPAIHELRRRHLHSTLIDHLRLQHWRGVFVAIHGHHSVVELHVEIHVMRVDGSIGNSVNKTRKLVAAVYLGLRCPLVQVLVLLFGELDIHAIWALLVVLIHLLLHHAVLLAVQDFEAWLLLALEYLKHILLSSLVCVTLRWEHLLLLLRLHGRPWQFGRLVENVSFISSCSCRGASAASIMVPSLRTVLATLAIGLVSTG